MKKNFMDMSQTLKNQRLTIYIAELKQEGIVPPILPLWGDNFRGDSIVGKVLVGAVPL